MRHAIPCGTDRSDPVQILKMTPVLPGAITENELIRPARTTSATTAVRILLAALANCSGESRTVFMVVFLVGMQRMRCEVGHIDDRSAEMSARTNEFPEQIDFEAALNGTQE